LSNPLYFDQNVPQAIATGLRRRGVDVLLAFEDRTSRLRDEPLLERATALGRILVSEDRDFVRIADQWREAGRDFAGVIRIPRQRMSIGEMIEDLELIALVLDPSEVRNQTFYLPLR
jgi:Domain of unknown function (DUF5615)